MGPGAQGVESPKKPTIGEDVESLIEQTEIVVDKLNEVIEKLNHLVIRDEYQLAYKYKIGQTEKIALKIKG